MANSRCFEFYFSIRMKINYRYCRTFFIWNFIFLLNETKKKSKKANFLLFNFPILLLSTLLPNNLICIIKSPILISNLKRNYWNTFITHHLELFIWSSAQTFPIKYESVSSSGDSYENVYPKIHEWFFNQNVLRTPKTSNHSTHKTLFFMFIFSSSAHTHLFTYGAPSIFLKCYLFLFKKKKNTKNYFVV